MSISYIKNADGSASVSAAEKIKVFYLEDLKVNPWFAHRATPVQSEKLTKGGGKYLFRTVLGINLPTRRTSAPTSSAVNYNGKLKNTEVELLVSQPFETDVFPLEQGDLNQLDGINYSPIASNEITKGLIAAEIATETDAITKDANILSIDGTSATKELDQLKLVKEKIANYFAINADNTDWAGATSAIKAYDYFTGQNGSYDASELRVHLHPSKLMAFSNAITDAGSGSDLQYQEFVSGKVPMLGGVQIVSNKYILPGEVFIVPTKVTGTPDIDVMTTRIVQFDDVLQNLIAIKGQHYFDAKLVTPEVVTKVSFA